MAIGSPPTDTPPEQLFLDNLPLIEKVIEHTCRRHHFSGEEAKDFASTVKHKLIADDYAIIRKFKGDSSLGTYLTSVVKNLAKDYQDHRWGKWRPSAEALRLGPVAVRLDELLNRDGYSFDQACEILRTNHHVEQSWRELLEIAERLPSRSPRRMEGEDALEHLPAQGGNADERVLARERAEGWKRIMALLDPVLANLPVEDRVLIKMRIWSGFSVAQISRILKLDQKSLYRRIERILKALRQALEEKGIRREDVEDILGGDRS